MNINKNVIRAVLLSAGLFLSASASAWHGGGYHGGYHGGGYHGGYGGYHGGGYHGGGWYGGAYGAPGYYGGCGTIRVCNRYGSCWLQNRCY